MTARLDSEMEIRFKPNKKIREKKLKTALAMFYEEVENRLAEKEQLGFTGWDSESQCPRKSLMARAHHKMAELWMHLKSSYTEPVDVAAFMMMIWFRNEGVRKMRIEEHERKQNKEKK